MTPIDAVAIALDAPNIARRAKSLRNRLTKEITRIKREDPGIENMRGLPECFELEEYRAVLQSVRWVLFGRKH